MDRDQAEKRITAIMFPRMLLVVLSFVAGLIGATWGYRDFGVVCVAFGTVLASVTLVRVMWLRRQLEEGS